MQIREIRESWGIEDESAEDFASQVYGVKFDFTSGSPGYCGDVYILQGDALTGEPPVVLTRHQGQLRLEELA